MERSYNCHIISPLSLSLSLCLFIGRGGGRTELIEFVHNFLNGKSNQRMEYK